MNYQNYQNSMLLTSSDTKRTLMHLFLFTNSAQREHGFNMYAEYTQLQLTFLAFVPWKQVKCVVPAWDQDVRVSGCQGVRMSPSGRKHLCACSNRIFSNKSNVSVTLSKSHIFNVHISKGCQDVWKIHYVRMLVW